MKRITWIFSIVGIVSAAALSGCLQGYDPPTPEEILKKQLDLVDENKLASDIQIIEDSLDRWSLTATAEPHGVRYIVHQAGTGPTPKLSSLITLKYTGKFLSNGQTFDSNDNAVFPLQDLIVGWKTTLPLLPEGTKATLYIPSGLAYGSAGYTDPRTGQVIIPPNMNMIFEIELKDVQ
jgi:FKBP-type peptidyl-prolyl cis-trans isomerase